MAGLRERNETRRETEARKASEATDAHRKRLTGLLTAGVLTVAIVVGIVIVIVVAAGGSGESSDSGAAFGTHYSGLEERRVQAGVPGFRRPPEQERERLSGRNAGAPTDRLSRRDVWASSADPASASAALLRAGLGPGPAESFRLRCDGRF